MDEKRRICIIGFPFIRMLEINFPGVEKNKISRQQENFISGYVVQDNALDGLWLLK